MPELPRSIFDLFTYDEPVQDRWRGVFSNNFNISILELKHGWLTLKINYPGKNFSYQASHYGSNDALTPLLEAITDLLEFIGDYDKYFDTLRTHTRVVHTGEPTEYIWDFNRQGSELRILLREDPPLEYELDRFYNNYTSDELELEYKDVTEQSIQAPLLLAVKIDVDVFVVKLYLAFRKLLASKPAADYEQDYSIKYLTELLRRLEQWIMISFPQTTGLWHYTSNDYSIRVTGRNDLKKFAVLGRRMATEAELKQIGLW